MALFRDTLCFILIHKILLKILCIVYKWLDQDVAIGRQRCWSAGVQVDASVVNPISTLPDVPVVVSVLIISFGHPSLVQIVMYLWTRVILWVVDENPARGLHIACLKVIHHPEPVVEDSLVVEVEVVGVVLPIVESRVRVGGIAFAICPHIGKSGNWTLSLIFYVFNVYKTCKA